MEGRAVSEIVKPCMVRLCQDCEMDGEEAPATVEWTDPWGHPYAYLCAACEEKRQDAYEPPTFDEALGRKCDEQMRVDEALRLKR